MGISYRYKAAIAVVTLLTCLGLVREHSVGAESPRIMEGSNITFAYHLTIPGESGFEVQDLGQFVQGQHQGLPALEGLVAGMKAGDEKNVELSVEEGFGLYDEMKKKTVPKNDLPAGIKEGDVIKDGVGQQATVAQLSDRSAVVDYNHPLAGKPLVMKIKILQVDNPK